MTECPGFGEVLGRLMERRGLGAARACRAGRHPGSWAAVVYARVSSADQRPDLDRQVARVTAWATAQVVAVDRVVTEVGPALDGHRRKFLALLRDPSVSVIASARPTCPS